MAVAHILRTIRDLQLVTSAGAYAANDQIGAAREITNALDSDSNYAVLRSVSVFDEDGQKSTIDFLFFDEQPTVVSADKDAVDIAWAEIQAKFLGVLRVDTTEYKDINGSSVSVATVTPDGGLILRSSPDPKKKSRSIWVVPVTRGTPTYPNADSLKVRFGLEQS